MTEVAGRRAAPTLAADAITARRVCVLSEDLAGPLDEGVKKFARQVADELGRFHQVHVLSTGGADVEPGIRSVRAGRTFLSARLGLALARANPEVIFYVARASTTLMAFVRSRVLKLLCPRASVVLVGLQARRHGALALRAAPGSRQEPHSAPGREGAHV